MSIDDYQKPFLTTDMVLFRTEVMEAKKRKIDELELQILLIKRTDNPQKGFLALPGGFVNINEEIGANVMRKLEEKTGFSGDFYTEQLYTKGDVGRDPRGRVISVSYLGLCNKDMMGETNWKSEAGWFSVDEILKSDKIAFDHKEIIAYAIERIKNKAEYTNIVLNLMPKEFTIAECKRVYELFLDKEVLNLKRKIDEYIIQLENRKQEGKAFHPAQLYKLKNKQ